MVSPILRLLAIYVAVAVALFAFFNRDRVTEMLGWAQPDPAPESATATPPEPRSEPTPEAQSEAPPEAQPIAPPETTGSAPVFAPQPGENGVPEQSTRDGAPEAEPVRASETVAVPEPVAPPAPILQTPTPPAGASTAGLEPPAQPVNPVQPTPQPASPSTAGLQTPVPAAPAASADAPATVPANLEDGLADARAKYWQNDIPGAIAAYRALLEEYPDNETLHGELGNIYFLNGQRVEAATQYEAAAMAALKAGHRQQAQALLGVLGSLDRSAAERVQAALEETP